MKPRQVPIFLYWRVENVQFWINSIGHLGWLISCILNFPRFHKNVNSLELWKYISENSSPKGSFWLNKRKSEFSSLSAASRYLLAVALKFEIKQWFSAYQDQVCAWFSLARLPAVAAGKLFLYHFLIETTLSFVFWLLEPVQCLGKTFLYLIFCPVT